MVQLITSGKQRESKDFIDFFVHTSVANALDGLVMKMVQIPLNFE